MVKVSVLIACYNSEGHIDRAVESLRAQTMPDWEAIIVDDASTDRTVETVHKLCQADARLRLDQLAINGGPGVARNAALAQSKGEWIAILDADDALRPDRLEKMVTVAEQHQLDLLFDNLLLFDDATQETSGQTDLFRGPLTAVTLEDMIASEGPRSPFRMGMLKPLIRRDFLTKNNLSYWDDLRLAEDFTLYAECLLNGARAAVLREAMYVYTTAVGQKSGKRSRGTRTVFTPEVRVVIADRLIERYDKRCSVQALGLLGRYRVWGQMYEDVLAAWVNLRNRRIGAAIRIFSRNPAAARYFFAHFAPARLKRAVLGRRSAV